MHGEQNIKKKRKEKEKPKEDIKINQNTSIP